MSDTAIDALKAPEEDGGVLIWPDARSLATIAERNRQLRRTLQFELMGRAASELIAAGPDMVTIATGHQPGFLHPGVWIKSVASCALAAHFKSPACFLVVDNDALQQSAMKWPLEHGDFLRVQSAYPFRFPLEWPYELLPESTSTEWKEFFGAIPSRMQTDPHTAMPSFLEGFMHDGRDESYIARWINGMCAMEKRLECQSPRYSPVSEWFDAQSRPGAACFLGHLMAHAGQFATAYNAALKSYRERAGIRGTQHPIPDLAAGDDSVEIPFWGLHPGRRRERLSVRSGPGRISLYAAGEVIAEIGEDALRRDPGTHLIQALGEWRIRPRALTLTMFTRLMGCDLFIHGIGGAKYDQISDECIRTFFGVEPPAYACVSATLRLDLPRFDAGEDDLLRRGRVQRDMRYNPQRFLTDGAVGSASGALQERRTAIGLAEQLRTSDPGNRTARRTAYDRIQRSNLALNGYLEDHGDCCMETLQARVSHNKVAGYREWFMGFYPIQKLRSLSEAAIEQLNG
jgi:hypothetical protein